MSNSPLVSYTKISPNKTSPRTKPIDRVSVHCVVGQCSIETLGNVFAPADRMASSNYGVGYDGRIGMYVEEKDRSWCTSSSENDDRAITIEVASDTYDPYAVTDAAMKGLIDLLADICKRNGKSKLIWIPDKVKALAYAPAADEMLMTVHRWFASKSCPGEYLYSRHAQIAATVTELLTPKVIGSGDHPSAWAQEACAWAKAQGIFKGDGAGNFDWQAPVTREQAAQILYNLTAAAGKNNEKRPRS